MLNDNDDTRKIVEQCYKRHKTNMNPIIDWTSGEVWEFIHAERADYCGMYDCGFSRLGCIGCPMASQHGREKEFLQWPTYKAMYIRTFDKMLAERERRGKETERWDTGQDVFNWWMEYDTLPGQIDLLED